MTIRDASRTMRSSLSLGIVFASLLVVGLWVLSTTPALGATSPPVATPNPRNPNQTATPTRTPSADITVSKSGPGSAYGGSIIQYVVSLYNAGPLSTTATITDTLSAAVAWQNTSQDSGVSCNPPAGTNIVCQVGAIGVSATKRITITVAINMGAPSPVINFVQASSPGDPAVTSASVSTSVLATPTPSYTPTGGVPTPDAAECNNDFAHAYRVSVGQAAMTLNFVPPPPGSCGSLPIGQNDIDYFVVHMKNDDWFQATTSVTPGIDTYMRLYDRNYALIAENDDISPTNYGSQIDWRSHYDGDYYIQLTDVDPNAPRTATYTFVVVALSNQPTPTPSLSPTPGPTWPAGMDSCEPDYDFDHACIVAAGVPKDGLNFVSADPNAPDNDYFALWQKPGLQYTCETDNLAPGLDTNMIMYDANRNGVGGNDDCTLGTLRSCMSWTSTYTGWVYFLVGAVGQLPPGLTSTYTFKCSLTVPSTPSPTATSTPWTPLPFFTPATPTPPLPPTLPPPTIAPPTPTAPIFWQPLATPTPISGAAAIVRVDVQIYYDANQNGELDEGEGIVGVRAQLVDGDGAVLDSRATGANGSVRLSAVAVGDVYLEVPYLSVRVPVAGPQASVQVRILPQPLPTIIP